MQWIHDYQLFLFDFDGLLVNTEEIHYRAYQRMCRDRGYPLPWSFEEYCQAAHYDSEKLRESVYETLPALRAIEPDWSILYAEKKRAMLELLEGGAVRLMPGAARLLGELAAAGIAHCVVTNSPEEQIQIIRSQNPALNTIPHWFTRETYTHPKPHPECYLNAIAKTGAQGKKVIGFEDTPRGLNALLQTPATVMLITQVPYPEIPEFMRKGAKHYPSLEALPETLLESSSSPG